MVYDLDELICDLGGNNEYGTERIIAIKAKEYLTGHEIINLYYKNLFKNHDNAELYIFTEDKVFVFTCLKGTGDKKDINITIRKLDDINDIKVSDDISYEMEIDLMITFKNGFIIALNNIKDTNNYHNSKFKEAIKDILKQLM